MKTETWAGHEIRFIEKEGEWWAVAKDVANALDYKHTPHMVRMLSEKDKAVHKVDTTSGKKKCPETQEMLIISEFGIYKAIFSSRKPEAEDFQNWTFNVLKELRQSSGIEGFGIFRMLDKKHQVDMMENLQKGLREPKRVDFIKANTIANKAVSTMYGYPKSIKKGDMSPDMLATREPVLEDTVRLMSASDSFSLGLSVSKLVYDKYTKSPA